ncbi:MAG TPA: peptide ABC transporter substrate-binding protein [Opitutaceae bacterium]
MRSAPAIAEGDGWVMTHLKRLRLRALAPFRLLVVAALVLAGCHREPVAEPAAATSVISISQRNEPSDLDPALAPLPDDFFIIRALSEGLVLPAMPGDSGPTPGAASSWDVSADRLVWTFHLRPGLKWSNGEPLVAQDFVDSFRRVRSPSTPAPRAELFDPVSEFSAPDPYTVVARLNQPNDHLLEYAASGPWIPVNLRVVSRWGRAWTRPEHFVGNGPYVLAEWTPHQRIVVRRNPLFRDPALVRVGELRFLHFDDGNAEDRAFRTGQVDVTMSVPVDRLPAYRQENPSPLHSAPLAETRYLAFNTQRPPLDRPEVRRALSLAIDRDALVRDVLRAGQQPAYSLGPNLNGASLSQSGDAENSLSPSNEARRILAAAGFPDGRGFPALELAGWSGNAGNQVLQAVQQMWRERLGINVTLVSREARVHLAALQNGQFDIALVARIPWVEDPRDVLDTFASGNPNNYPHWQDTLYDRLMRSGDLLAAEARLDAALPGTPLYFNRHNWLMRARVGGWRENGRWERSYLSLRVEGR